MHDMFSMHEGNHHTAKEEQGITGPCVAQLSSQLGANHAQPPWWWWQAQPAPAANKIPARGPTAWACSDPGEGLLSGVRNVQPVDPKPGVGWGKCFKTGRRLAPQLPAPSLNHPHQESSTSG